MDIGKIREEFPVTKNLIYFNHAAVGPLPLCSSRKVKKFLEECNENGCLNYPAWIEYQEKVRGLVAQMLGGKTGEVALVKNTSTGISIVAQGLKWEEGDNVIIPESEFPANVYPWFNLKNRGVDVRIVKERNGRLFLNDFEALMDDRTRLLSVSWVEFASGFRNDIEALGNLCKRREIYFCVDAIQGLGVFEMDVEKYNIDFLAADGHKWLLAPEGIGILYVSERVIDDLHPSTVGWNSVEDPCNYHPYHFERLKKDAKKFEEGSPNLLGTFALGASLELIINSGIKKIGERVIKLTDILAEGLERKGYRILSPRRDEEKSGILVFTSGKGDEGLLNCLMEKKVFCALRGGGIRLSPHFYNSEEEVERFFTILSNAPLAKAQ